MFERTRYLEWARRFHGTVRFDLASSGIPTASMRDLGSLDAERFDAPAGWAQLSEAIAAYNDVPCTETIAALGTTHALWLAYAALTSPGDEVLVEEPAYEPLVRIAEGVGARVVRFARASSERFAIDPQRIAEAMTSRVRLVAVTDLHNPSGVRASDDVLREAARIVGERGAYLLVDEVYGAFDALVAPSGTFGRSARKLAPNIVAISSLTKCYGLGPERIGWLLGPADAICRARDAITASCGMLPLSHSHIALRAFANISVLAARSRAILAGKREIVRGWVESLGLSWSAPREGLFCLVSVTGSDDLTPVIEAAARERDVLVVPGTFFGAPSSFRLAWSAPVEVLEEGLGRLAEALRQARLTGRC